jgi:hypothetical protein
MRKIAIVLLLSLATSAFPQETREQRRCRRGQEMGYASRDVTAVSMMGWGIGLAVGIGLLCGLLHDSPAR